MTSWDYVQARMAEQEATAEHRRRVATLRPRRGVADRVTAFVRSRVGHTDETSGCRN